MLRLLKYLLLAAGGLLLIVNIEPYIAVTQLIFSDKTSGVDVCSTIGGMPFVGGILKGGCGLIGEFAYALAGFVVWGIFQIVELLPIANSFQIPFISGVLAKLQNAAIPNSDFDKW